MLMNIGKIKNNCPINPNFAMRFVMRARIALKSKLLINGWLYKTKIEGVILHYNEGIEQDFSSLYECFRVSKLDFLNSFWNNNK